MFVGFSLNSFAWLVESECLSGKFAVSFKSCSELYNMEYWLGVAVMLPYCVRVELECAVEWLAWGGACKWCVCVCCGYRNMLPCHCHSFRSTLGRPRNLLTSTQLNQLHTSYIIGSWNCIYQPEILNDDEVKCLQRLFL